MSDEFEVSLEKSDSQRIRWRRDPIAFFTEALDVEPKNVWEMMEIMGHMIRDNQKVAIKAAHSVSKTYTMARVVLWFLYCWNPSTVVTTAPCYDKETEILTDSGWKLFKDLDGTECVGQFTDEGECKLTKPLEYFKFPYKGELIGYKSQLCDFLVTPNHKCVIEKGGGYSFAKADELYRKWDKKIPKVYRDTKPGVKRSLAFCEFLGFWFAEGTVQYNTDRRKYVVQITQKKYCDYLEKLLIANDYSYRKYKKSGGYSGCFNGCYSYEINSKQLAMFFVRYKETAKCKKLDDFILSFNAEQADAFLQGFCMGDGSFTEGDTRRHYTSSEELADGLQLLANTCGNAATICKQKNGMYVIGEWKRRGKTINTNKKYWYKEQYNDFVYCVRVPSGKLITRRNKSIVISGNTHTQVEELLWREIREAHANARIPLGGNITKTKLDLQEKVKKGQKAIRWFAFGFSTKPDQGQEHATKMQGFHNEYMLVIFDEADGILQAIWNAIDALLTNVRVKFCAIGNPLRPTGPFADCFKDSSYAKLTISTLDTPNYKEGREVIHGLSGREYESDMRKKWGVDSNMYKSRVLGQIPDSDPESIVAVSWYERAEKAVLHDVSGIIKRFVTVDVADGGNDETVVKGWKAGKKMLTQTNEWRYPGKRADEIDSDVIRNVREIEGNAIVFDNDGCGRILGGLLTGILGKDRGIHVIPFTGSAEAYVDEDYTNRRAEAHFDMHLKFRDHNISVFPGNEKAKRDVTTVRWDTQRKGNRKGKIDVEAKDKLKPRLGGDSPDDGDNIMMACGSMDEVPAIEKKDMYVRRAKRKSRGWKAA